MEKSPINKKAGNRKLQWLRDILQTNFNTIIDFSNIESSKIIDSSWTDENYSLNKLVTLKEVWKKNKLSRSLT